MNYPQKNEYLATGLFNISVVLCVDKISCRHAGALMWLAYRFPAGRLLKTLYPMFAE